MGADDPGIQLGLGHHVPLHRGGAEELHLAEDLAVTLNLAELEDAARVDGAIEGDPTMFDQIELLALLPLPHDQFARQVTAQKQGAGVERRGKAGFKLLEFGVKTAEGVGLLLHDLPVAPDDEGHEASKSAGRIPARTVADVPQLTVYGLLHQGVEGSRDGVLLTGHHRLFGAGVIRYPLLHILLEQHYVAEHGGDPYLAQATYGQQ